MNTLTGVYPDFSTSEFISLKHAKDAGCIFILKKPEQGTSVRPVLDLDGNELPFIQIGKWKVHKPIENRRTSVTYKSQLQIEDPRGEVRFYNFDNPLTIHTIIGTLRELSAFSSWKEYMLQIRVNTLEEEIKKLKSQKND